MYLDLLTPINLKPEQDTFENIFNVKYQDGIEFPGLNGHGIAFITNQSNFCDEVRFNLTQYKNHFRNITIYDMGSLKDVKENSISSLTNHLNNHGIIPIFIGLDLKMSGALAVEHSKNITIISNHIELIEYKNSTAKVNHVGYQRHLCSLSDIYEIEENMYNALSLGKMRSYPSQLEPTLRDTHILHVNLDCMRMSEAPGTIGTLPSGLNAEELCQTMKYTGTADNLSAIFITCELSSENHQPEASLVAESIWYFMEGVNMNTKDHPTVSKDFSAFIVHSNILDDDLEFLKHNQTAKWWLSYTNNNMNKHFLACSYEEYQFCVRNEIPDRFLKFIHEIEK